MTIQQLLSQYGYTADQVSSTTCIPQTTVSSILSGELSIEDCSVKTVQLLSVLLGRHIEDLLQMPNSDQDNANKILSIQAICDLCHPIFEMGPIKSAYLFGSYARGDATASSDVDIVVDATEKLGRKLLAMNSLLESVLGKPVDIYEKTEIPFLMAEIERDKRLIYFKHPSCSGQRNYDRISSLKQAELQKILDVLPESVDELWVFGSAVTPYCRPDSNIDVCVVGDSITKDDRKTIAHAPRYGIDLLNVSHEEFETEREKSGSVFHEVYTKGLLIYKKGDGLVGGNDNARNTRAISTRGRLAPYASEDLRAEEEAVKTGTT